MLGGIYQAINDTSDGSLYPYSPWYEYIAGEDTMLNDILSQKQYWTEFAIGNQEFPQCYTCPKAANIFNSLDFGSNATSPKKIDYQVLIDTQLDGSDAFSLEHTMINMIDTAFLKYATNINWTIVTWSQPLPYVTEIPAFDIGSFLGLLLYPFAVSFVMAIYVNSIVKEKEDRLREMMRMMGMKMSWYWFVNYIWDMFLYLLIIGIMILTSVCFLLRMFTQTSILIWIIILFGWGNAQIALSFLLSTFFNKARTATIVAYSLVIAGVVFSYVLNATVFQQNTDNPYIYIIFFLYPPFACYRAIYLIGAGCTILECPQLTDIEVGGEMFYIMIFLYVDSVFYSLIAL